MMRPELRHYTAQWPAAVLWLGYWGHVAGASSRSCSSSSSMIRFECMPMKCWSELQKRDDEA